MELELKIKFASVSELALVASSLKGLPVETSQTPTKVSASASTVEQVATQVTGNSVVTPTPEAPATPKKKTAAEKKAEKKALEEKEKNERIERLKANMAAATPGINTEVMPPQQPAAATYEDPNSIVEEIKKLGDTLNQFTGIPVEQKQQLTADIMRNINAPEGVRPTQLQQPLLGAFRDAYRGAVNSIVNPVMGGLV